MKTKATEFVLTALLLAATLAVVSIAMKRPPDHLAQPLETVGREMAGWQMTGTSKLEQNVLDVLLPTSYLSRQYQKGGQPLDLFIAYYAQQLSGESMHSPKNCLPGSGWEISEYGSTLIPMQNQKVKVNRYQIQNGGRSYLVFYWYQSKTRVIASEYLGKILLVRDSILDGTSAGSLVRVILPDTPGGREEGTAFSAALIPQVQRCFGR